MKKLFIITMLLSIGSVTSIYAQNCDEGFYTIEENSCCTNGTYNGCCGAYGSTQPSSCIGGDPNFQPSYGYFGSDG